MESIAHWQLLVAVVAVILGFTGLWFAMPNLLRYLKDLSKEKRQNAIRDALLRYGSGGVDDFKLWYPHLSQKQIEKAINELLRSGEITENRDAHDRLKWHFTVHPTRRR
jgi:hypothetical protein